MDLFGRKAKKEVLAIRRSLLTAQLDLVMANASNRRLTAAADGLAKAVEDKSVEIKRLKQALAEAQAPAKFSQHPLYYTEDQEDLEWQLANKLIDATEYKDALAQVGFDNAEIELASEYLDSTDHSNLSY